LPILTSSPSFSKNSSNGIVVVALGTISPFQERDAASADYSGELLFVAKHSSADIVGTVTRAPMGGGQVRSRVIHILLGFIAGKTWRE
jgi:hypothetical protein